jgi:hypothetical protein
LVELGLRRGRNAVAIWQDLISDHGFAGSYQTVKRSVRKLRGPQGPEATGIILTAAGEEAQVDYGSGPMGAQCLYLSIVVLTSPLRALASVLLSDFHGVSRAGGPKGQLRWCCIERLSWQRLPGI